MSSPQVSRDVAAAPSAPATPTLRLEVVVLPVGDVDRARSFYEGLGWRLDADLTVDEGYRVVQLTPPGSPASIIFGQGTTTMAPGTVQDLMLVVEDLDAARDELIRAGADVSAIWHDESGVFHHAGTSARIDGRSPGGASYSSWASFSDPDGNGWLLQEITERLPGPDVTVDVAALAQLLQETSERHGAFEAVAPPHHWWDWYAAFMVARQDGSPPDDAATIADRYMATMHVVPSPGARAGDR